MIFFLSAGFSNNPRLSFLQPRAQKGLWQIHPILFRQGKQNAFYSIEFNLNLIQVFSYFIALCQSFTVTQIHSFLSKRRTPLWMQLRTSWENLVKLKDSKIFHSVGHTVTHYSSSCAIIFIKQKKLYNIFLSNCRDICLVSNRLNKALNKSTSSLSHSLIGTAFLSHKRMWMAQLSAVHI